MSLYKLGMGPLLRKSRGQARIGAAPITNEGNVATFENVATYDDMWEAQRAFLALARGSDRLAPPEGFGGSPLDIPRSTNADVIQLADYWNAQFDREKAVMGDAGVQADWNGAMNKVGILARSNPPSDRYLLNNEFWRQSLRVAIQAAISRESPSKMDMFLDSLKVSVRDLPASLARTANQAGDVFATTTGELAKGIVFGVLGELKLPLLLAGGAWVGFKIWEGRKGG